MRYLTHPIGMVLFFGTIVATLILVLGGPWGMASFTGLTSGLVFTAWHFAMKEP